MGNVTEEKWIDMLEKKADGNYIAKYPKVKSKSGVTFDEHLAEKATKTELGHIVLSDVIPIELDDIKSINPYVVPGWDIVTCKHTFALEAGKIYYIPIALNKATAFSAVAIGVYTAATSISVKIYDSLADKFSPNAEILDVGTFDITSTGNKEITYDFTLPAGYYFIAFRSTAGTAQIIGIDAGINTFSSPFSTRLSSIEAGAVGGLIYTVTANLTNPAPTPTGINSSQYIPLVFLKLKG